MIIIDSFQTLTVYHVLEFSHQSGPGLLGLAHSDTTVLDNVVRHRVHVQVGQHVGKIDVRADGFAVVGDVGRRSDPFAVGQYELWHVFGRVFRPSWRPRHD